MTPTERMQDVMRRWQDAAAIGAPFPLGTEIESAICAAEIATLERAAATLDRYHGYREDPLARERCLDARAAIRAEIERRKKGGA